MTNPVSLKFNEVSFICVPLAEADFSDVAAVYVIICVAPGGQYRVIDVGQSGEVGTRIISHDRKDEWKKVCPSGNIWVCIYRMPTNQFSKEQRLAFEKETRENEKPLCGDR